MSTEVKDLLQDLNKEFHQFKEKHQEELKAIKNNEGTAEVKEQLEKYNSRMDELEIKIKQQKAAKDQDSKVKGDAKVNEAYKEYYLKGHESSDQTKSILREEMSKRGVKSMSTDSFIDGGIFSRPQFDTDLINLFIETSPVRSVADVKRLNSGDALTLARNTRKPGTSWVNERSSSGDTQTPQFQEVRIQTHEQDARPYISRQQIEDSIINIESEVQRQVNEQLGYDQNTAFISGNGVTRPEGILTGLSSARQQGLGAASGGLEADDIIDLAFSVKDKYLMNASWMFNRLTLGEIRKLQDTNGSYIWTPNEAALVGGSPATLLGYPYAMADDLVAPSGGSYSNGDKPILFGDFREGYCIVDRINTELLVDPYSAKPFIEYYFRTRVGGKVKQEQALTYAEFTS